LIAEKIYENLEYMPEPTGYSSKIPWVIPQQVAATNGIHFVDSIGKLDEIPILVPKRKNCIYRLVAIIQQAIAIFSSE